MAETTKDTEKKSPQKVLQISHLLISRRGLSLGRNGDRVYVRQNGKTLYEAFLEGLESILVDTHYASLSSDLIALCASSGIPVIWISPKGQVEALALNPDTAELDVLTRQIDISRDPSETLSLAKLIVKSKIINQLNLIKYFGKYEQARNQKFTEGLSKMLQSGKALLAELRAVKPSADLLHVRGQLFSIEGRMASHYWDMVKLLLEGVNDFPGRVRKGAKDLVNRLLNYGYAILRTRVLIELHRHKISPHISFLHVAGNGRATLSFDLMEIFRSQVVDRVVISELRRHAQVFTIDEQGLLAEESRRHLSDQIHERFRRIEAFRGRKMTMEQIIREQVKALKQHIKEMGRFKPYLAKW